MPGRSSRRTIGAMRTWLLRAAVALVLLFGLAQLVPYGRDHANPPVTREVRCDSARTRELAVGACYDCHSNLTVWPWYSNCLLYTSDAADERSSVDLGG